jgi:hypothetical protein
MSKICVRRNTRYLAKPKIQTLEAKDIVNEIHNKLGELGDSEEGKQGNHDRVRHRGFI